MKNIHSFIIRNGLFAGVIIALIVLSIVASAYAARVAGTDEDINTTIMPEQPSREVKTENTIQKPMEVRIEKLSAEPVKKEVAKKYVTLDFDNVDIGVLVKFVSELTG
jgi:hypothetical protein